MMQTQERVANIIVSGQRQAIRLPKQFELEGIDKVVIRKEGEVLIITPLKKTWTSFAALPKADDDFMSERTELLESDRVGF